MDLRPVMSHEDEPNLTILFNIWEISEGWSFYGSMIAIILMGLLYEALKQINPGHLVSSQLSYGKTSSQQNLLNQSVESYRQESPRGMWNPDIFNFFHLFQTTLYLLEITLRYLLMLTVMSENVWCFIAVLIGCTLGYFSFGWKRQHISEEKGCRK